jgi:hypothetical protein
MLHIYGEMAELRAFFVIRVSVPLNDPLLLPGGDPAGFFSLSPITPCLLPAALVTPWFS